MPHSKFVTLKDGEQITFLLRRHPFTFAYTLFVFFLLLIVPIAIRVLLSLGIVTFEVGDALRIALILLTSAYYLGIWLFLYSEFVNYYLDTWIVTTGRILSIEQRGLFSREIAELDLTRVQDVTSEVKGMMNTLFNYGNVYIQTAGKTERFDFENISNPDEVRQKILELSAADRKREGAEVVEDISLQK